MWRNYLIFIKKINLFYPGFEPGTLNLDHWCSTTKLIELLLSTDIFFHPDSYLSSIWNKTLNPEEPIVGSCSWFIFIFSQNEPNNSTQYGSHLDDGFQRLPRWWNGWEGHLGGVSTHADLDPLPGDGAGLHALVGGVPCVPRDVYGPPASPIGNCWTKCKLKYEKVFTKPRFFMYPRWRDISLI